MAKKSNKKGKSSYSRKVETPKEIVPAIDELEKEIKTKRTSYAKSSKEVDMLFGKQHFILVGAGLLIVVIGFFLMSGGSMPDENTWDPNLIYSFRRITLAPIVVLIGLAFVGYALFFNTKKDKKSQEEKEVSYSEE